MSQIEELKIRPYARLLTMLGNQLIKDEAIALIELIKNAYDADAENVRVSFKDFNEDYTANKLSSIIIADDGNGMNESIIKNAWMNPATPEKLKRKRKNRTTDKSRIMQGEKGIGRFALLKLGKTIDILTRRQKNIRGHFIDAPESDNEYCLRYDFTDYDTDFTRKGDEEKDIYLDDLSVSFSERKAKQIISKHEAIDEYSVSNKPYGTIIIISNLNGKWNRNKIDKVFSGVERMRPIFGAEFISDFNIGVWFNKKPYLSNKKDIETIRRLLEEKAVLIADGSFNAENRTIEYDLTKNGKISHFLFGLYDSAIYGIKPMRSYLDSIKKREIECGSFSYKFYIMDLNVNLHDTDTRYYIDPEDRDSIREHRVYLYRDGIRVLPYGDPEDDWLGLDTIRGTQSASHIFANDQIVGYVSISQENNPGLIDKTNREGLIEEGFAREDLINICQLILRYLRANPYSQYLQDKKNSREKKEAFTNQPLKLINQAREEKIGEKVINDIIKKVGKIKISDIPQEQIAEGEKKVYKFLDQIEQSYKTEKEIYERRITATENLAAIGLSAETAYHDARMIISETNSQLKSLLTEYKHQSTDYLLRKTVVESIEPINTQLQTASVLMKNVQKLFPSTKSHKREISVQQQIITVRNLYKKSLDKAGIKCEIRNDSSNPILVECTDAVLLQVFINLFDNALYWLKTDGTDRRILIILNSYEKEVLFSDSGPGIQPKDEPYIFEAFISGKGEDGKGLGLYIARQLLNRYNYSIELEHDNNTRYPLLKGASFRIDFGREEDNNESD